jgi:hypothetical protein
VDSPLLRTVWDDRKDKISSELENQTVVVCSCTAKVMAAINILYLKCDFLTNVFV